MTIPHLQYTLHCFNPIVSCPTISTWRKRHNRHTNSDLEGSAQSIWFLLTAKSLMSVQMQWQAPKRSRKRRPKCLLCTALRVATVDCSREEVHPENGVKGTRVRYRERTSSASKTVRC